MAFPQSVLPLRVRIAPGAVAADPATWSWVDITSWVRVASGVSVEWGKSDSAARVDPSKATLVLDNRDGRFSTRNPLGPWYGSLVKGTPLRVGTIAVADTFTRTSSNTWGSPETGGGIWVTSAPASAWSVNGSSGLVSFAAANVTMATRVASTELLDVDAQFTLSVPAVMTGASMVVGFYVRYLDAGNFYLLSAEFNPAGTVTAKIRVAAAGVWSELATLTTVPGLTYTAGQKLRVQVQGDGPALRIRIWPDGSTPPATWTLTTTDTSITTAGLVGVLLWRVAGNTNTSPLVVSVDDLEVEAVEYTGQVYEWPPRWDKSGKDATAPITASGILRRLQQGKSPLRSPLARALTRWNPTAYWRLEDGTGAVNAASALPGGRAATAREVQWAQDSPQLYGAQQAAGITTSTVMTGIIPTMASGTWSFVCFLNLLAPPAATTRLMTVTATGTVRTWAIDADNAGFIQRGYNADNTLVVEQYGSWPLQGGAPPGWMALNLYLFQTGGNVTARLYYYGIIGNADDVSAVFTGQTIAGTAGRPTQWSMQGSLGFDGGRLAHVAAYPGAFPFITTEFANAANGYIGEPAAARVARLCAEENVQVVVETGDSEPMGPQGVDTFLNLLYSCEDADPGLLYERGAGLGYRPRGARYNQPVDLALNFAAGDIAEPPEPVDDDQRLKNQITVSRPGGSEATSADPVSIAQVGLIDDAVTINVETDNRLPDHAAWRRHLTTGDEYRWPSLALNLARNTGQIRKWRAAGPMPRLTVSNPPTQVPGTTVDQIAEGYTATYGPYTWDIGLACTPATPWDVAVYDATSSRYDLATCTMSASAAAGVTSLALMMAAGESWSLSTPYDLMISGERVTATEISSPGAVGAVTGMMETTAEVALWSAGTGGTPVRSSAQARYGSFSALLTVTGSPATATLRLASSADFAPITPGATYTLSYWVYSSIASTSVGGAINWYLGAVYVSTSAPAGVSIAANTWTRVTYTATAPAAGVDRAQYGPSVGASPANGTLLYFDGIELIGSSVTQQKATVTRAVNGISKLLPAGAEVHIADPARYAL